MRQTTRDFVLLAFAVRRRPPCVPSEEWTRIIVDRFDRSFSFVPPFVRSSNTRYIGSFAGNENRVSARVNLSSSLFRGFIRVRFFSFIRQILHAVYSVLNRRPCPNYTISTKKDFNFLTLEIYATSSISSSRLNIELFG